MMFKKTVLAHALTVAFAVSIGSVAVSTSAYAQSNSAGAISGRAAAGTVVTIENRAIGFTRNVTVNQSGDFSVSQLPPGNYTLTARKPDGTTDTRQVAVVTGEGVSANFDAPAVNTVQVMGRAIRIDVKSPESNTTLNEATIDRLPVARDVTAVALLAPGATRGDGRIGSTSLRAGNVPSLGGASPAENVYYVNGFNVTNLMNGVGYSQVPFEGTAQLQIKTGGYGAEYGRSLGGVLSVTTKRGTNEWKGGANVIYTPESLSGSSIYSEKSPTSGEWGSSERPGGTNNLTSNIWLGGPVIEDKLFVFGLIQGANVKENVFGASNSTETVSDSPRYLLKVDWNITDKNLLELTAYSDEEKIKRRTWTLDRGYTDTRTNELLPNEYKTGGKNYIAKYTSWLTDDFTVSATGGIGQFLNNEMIGSAQCPYITDVRTSPTRIIGCGTTSSMNRQDAEDERRAIRVDAEWNLGNHGLRFGLDNETYEARSGSLTTGGGRYEISTVAAGGRLGNGYVNNTGSALDYVSMRYFENGGQFKTKNSAYYIEDNWQITKNFVANIGVRSESFENLNAAGESFIKVDDTIAPRLGFSWDVQGNQQTKIFGNAGRYYIPVMSNTNVRLSGAETDYRDFYAYTGSNGSDRFQIPGLGARLGERLVTSNGEAGDPRSVVDPDIEPMYQDEFILGVQQALAGRWSVGAKVTHRKLKSVMDDMCNGSGAQAWALGNGFNASQAGLIGNAIDHCFLYNPGGDLKANVDLEDGNGLTLVTIPSQALGFQKAERKYTALEFTFDRAWDGVWSLQGSYVWSKNRGNTEGYVKSDIGQDDAGISQDWDYPGLMEGSYGNLPNDRRHAFKAFGAYQLTPELRVGANLLLQSGRPVNCLGYYAGNLDDVSIGYESASFWCNSKLNPRGTLGNLAWTKEVGIQLNYEPKWLKGTTFQVDVLNVFNERKAITVDEGGELSQNTPDPSYLQPLYFQPARTVRFMAQYEF